MSQPSQAPRKDRSVVNIYIYIESGKGLGKSIGGTANDTSAPIIILVTQIYLSTYIHIEREGEGEKETERKGERKRERLVDIATPCEVIQVSGHEVCDIKHITMT